MKKNGIHSPLIDSVTMVLLLLPRTCLFVSSISALWGWTGVGVVSLLVMLAASFDERDTVKKALFYRGMLLESERNIALYYLALAVSAVIVNVLLLGLYVTE